MTPASTKKRPASDPVTPSKPVKKVRYHFFDTSSPYAAPAQPLITRDPSPEPVAPAEAQLNEDDLVKRGKEMLKFYSQYTTVNGAWTFVLPCGRENLAKDWIRSAQVIVYRDERAQTGTWTPPWAFTFSPEIVPFLKGFRCRVDAVVTAWAGVDGESRALGEDDQVMGALAASQNRLAKLGDKVNEDLKFFRYLRNEQRKAVAAMAAADGV